MHFLFAVMCLCAQYAFGRSFVEESGAGIKISPQDNNHVGLNDRLATITGSLEEQIHAIFLILSRLTEDTHYSQSIITPYPYAGVMPTMILFLSLTVLLLLVTLHLLPSPVTHLIPRKEYFFTIFLVICYSSLCFLIDTFLGSLIQVNIMLVLLTVCTEGGSGIGRVV